MEETEIREIPGTHDEKAGKAQPPARGLAGAAVSCSPGSPIPDCSLRNCDVLPFW